MKLQSLNGEFAVCKLPSLEEVDFSRELVFLSKTAEELSLLCEADAVPPNTLALETGWRGLKICGELDFGMIGVIAGISGLLAEKGVSVFVVSTYNTDYIFVKDGQYRDAVEALREGGYTVA